MFREQWRLRMYDFASRISVYYLSVLNKDLFFLPDSCACPSLFLTLCAVCAAPELTHRDTRISSNVNFSDDYFDLPIIRLTDTQYPVSSRYWTKGQPLPPDPPNFFWGAIEMKVCPRLGTGEAPLPGLKLWACRCRWGAVHPSGGLTTSHGTSHHTLPKISLWQTLDCLVRAMLQSLTTRPPPFLSLTLSLPWTPFPLCTPSTLF